MSIRIQFAIFLSCCFLLPVLCNSVTAQQNWPGFRNDGSGQIKLNDVPVKWSPDSDNIWRSDIPGYGQSAPVVYNGKVFLTSMDGPWQERCFVHRFNLDDGQLLWTSEFPATTRVENYFRNSRAAPTSVVDEQRVFSFFPGGDVVAHGHDGTQIWKVPLFEKFGAANNERGTASSLAQNANHVFVLVDHAGPSYLVALNKKDGSIVWKSERGARVESWASPAVIKSGNKELVIVSSSDSINAYNAGTGQEIWHVNDIQGNHIPSASVVNNSIYVGSTQMYGSTAEPDKIARSNCRIDVSFKDGTHQFEVKWSADRVNSYYSTPLAFADYVYYVNKAGVLFCISQQTGRRVFAKRIGNPCWASAIGVTTTSGEQYVYFFMKNGFSLVIRPGDQFDLVSRSQLWDYQELKAAEKAAEAARAKNKVPETEAKPKTGPEKMLANMPEKSLHKMFGYGDPIVYGTAIVDGSILIRTGQHLYCIRGEE